MHKVKHNSLELDFTLIPKSPLLIKSGGISPNPALPDMQFVRTFKSGKETVCIPGQSLKGVFRSHSEKIFKTKRGDDLEWVCDIFNKENSCSKAITDDDQSQEIYRKSCRICKTFGSTKLKSRVYIQDAYPEDEVKTETRYGVAISRLTHSVAHGPFDMEVLISGNFSSKIYIENFELWQIGLLALVFQGLNEGLVKIGFGKNRGFGEVETKIDKINFSFSKSIPNDEIWGISMFVSSEDNEKYGFKENDRIKTKAEPRERESFPFYIKEYEGKDWEKISLPIISTLKEML